MSTGGGQLWSLKSWEGPQTHSPWGPCCITACVSKPRVSTIDLLQRLNDYKEPGRNSAICLLSSFFHDIFFQQNQSTQWCLGGDSTYDGKSPGSGVRPLGFKHWLYHLLAGDLQQVSQAIRVLDFSSVKQGRALAGTSQIGVKIRWPFT